MKAIIKLLTEPASIELPVTLVPGYLQMNVEIMTMPLLDPWWGPAAVTGPMPTPLTGAGLMDRL